MSPVTSAIWWPSLMIVLLSSCGCSSIPNKKITVVNQDGAPVRGAGLNTAYPIRIIASHLRDAPSGNSTDSKGRLRAFDMQQGKLYTLSAPGHESITIKFPEKNNQVYVLKSTE